MLPLQDCNCSLSDVHLFFPVLPVHKELTDILSLKFSTYSMVIHLGYLHGLERLLRKTAMDDAFFPHLLPANWESLVSSLYCPGPRNRIFDLAFNIKDEQNPQ